MPVHDLIVHPRDNELVVATHGRSIWISDVKAIQSLKDYQDKDLALLPMDEIKFNSSWNSRPSRWFTTSKDEQLSSFNIWSAGDKQATIHVLDSDDQTLFDSTINLTKGLNIWHWNNKLNIEKALAAEELKNKDADKPLNKSLTPISEGLRLGHDIYIQKGKYKLRISSGESEATIGVKTACKI